MRKSWGVSVMSMKKSFRQTGGAMLNSIVATLALTGAAVYYDTVSNAADQSEEIAAVIATEIEHIQAASLRCYYVNRAWCSTSELTAYYTGDLESALGTNYYFSVNSNGQQVLKVQTVSDRVAESAKSMVVNGEATSGELTSVLPPPEDNLLFSDALARYENEMQQEAMEFETSIDFNEQNLSNADRLDVESATIRKLNSDAIEATDIVISGSLEVGQNSISDTGNGLAFNAKNIELQGATSVAGDIEFNGNNLTGAKTLVAANGSFRDLELESLTVQDGDVTRAIIEVADIDKLSGTSLQTTSAEGEKLGFDTANGSNIKTTSAQTVNTTTKVLTSDNGTATTAGGANIQYNTANITNANGNEINSTDVVLNSGTFTTLNSSSLIGNSILASRGQGDNVAADYSEADRAYFEYLNSSSTDATNVSALSGESDSVAVSGRTTTNHVATTTFTPTNLTTNKINSSTSTLGEASSTSFSVSNTLSALSFAATTAVITNTNGNVDATEGNFTTIKGTNTSATNGTFTNLTVNKYTGGSFTGTDFETSTSSVNENYAILDEYGNAIDNCINTSKFCIPETPVISFSCTGCSQANSQSTFTATLRASVSHCRQGCSVDWTVPSALTKSSGCSTTNISAGGTATLSCVVKSTLDPQESYSGTVKAKATNSHYTSESYTASKSVYFENNSSADPEVTTSCSGCNLSSERESFSATITGTVSCPYNCSYTWTETGGATKGACSNGTASAGQTKSVSCAISGTLVAGDSTNGSVKLTASINADTTFNDQDTETYAWENTSAEVTEPDDCRYNEVTSTGGVRPYYFVSEGSQSTTKWWNDVDVSDDPTYVKGEPKTSISSRNGITHIYEICKKGS